MSLALNALCSALVLTASPDAGSTDAGSTPRPRFYHPLDATGGYTDSKISDTIFYATFALPTETNAQGLINVARFRANEICFAAGKRFPRFFGTTSSAPPTAPTQPGGEYSGGIYFSCLDSAHGLRINVNELSAKEVPKPAADSSGGAVQVVAVPPDSPNVGVLLPKDIILRVNGQRTPTLAALTTTIDTAPDQDKVALQLLRGKSLLDVTARTADLTSMVADIASHDLDLGCINSAHESTPICVAHVQARERAKADRDAKGPYKLVATLPASVVEATGARSLRVVGNTAWVYSRADGVDKSGRMAFQLFRVKIAGDKISLEPMPALSLYWPTDANTINDCAGPWAPSDDGRSVVFWSKVTSLGIADAQTGTLQEEIAWPDGDGCRVGFGHDAHDIFQMGFNSTSRVWKRRSGQPADLLQTFRNTDRTQYNSVGLSFTPDDSQVLVYDYLNATLQRWSLAKRDYTGAPLKLDTKSMMPITPTFEVLFDAAGTRIVTRDMWRKYSGVITFDSGTQKAIDVLSPFGFSPDGRFISGAGPRAPRVLDAATGELVQELPGTTDSGGVLADGRVILLDWKNGLSVWAYAPQ